MASPPLVAGLLLAAQAAGPVVVDADAARALVTRPHAAVLDTRGLTSWVSGHVPGAVRVDWRIGTVGGPTSGKLGDPAALAAAFAKAGVWSDGPVLVVGAWDQGWGEEGRIAWDLLYLGHPDVHILRGGMPAWTGDVRHLPDGPPPGDFVARVRPELRVEAAQLQADPSAWRLVDARERSEFDGATPYGEARGGHIPGAVSVPWKTLLTGPPDLPRDRPIVTYCTGGVRSAMAWVLLRDAGYEDVRNYDGSWWEWARTVEGAASR